MTEVRFKFITENRKNDLSALKNRGGWGSGLKKLTRNIFQNN